MKILEIRRGSSPKPFKCDNGDLYDSSAILTDCGAVLYVSDLWNTDSTNGYKGGLLSKGEYYAIRGMRKVSYQDDPIPVFRVFSKIDLAHIKTSDDLPDEAYVLPSDIPNPNHDNKMIIKFVQLHPGSTKWDWSHGCLTALNYGGHNDFDRLISVTNPNEIILLRLL